jgi:hypothetical protein
LVQGFGDFLEVNEGHAHSTCHDELIETAETNEKAFAATSRPPSSSEENEQLVIGKFSHVRHLTIDGARRLRQSCR